MRKESGIAYQILVLLIIIIIAMAGVLINKIIGKNGVMEKVAEVETEFSKEDVLEKINDKVTQKFIELNNLAKENKQSISEIYNPTVVIEFLKQNFIIEEVYDEKGNFQEGIYDIHVEKLREEENQNTQIAGKFRLEKVGEKYRIRYYEGEDFQEIGELQIQQTI